MAFRPRLASVPRPGVNEMVCRQVQDLHDQILMVVLFSAPVTANFQNWTLEIGYMLYNHLHHGFSFVLLDVDVYNSMPLSWIYNLLQLMTCIKLVL